jgi:L-fucose isomerase-like protein
MEASAMTSEVAVTADAMLVSIHQLCDAHAKSEVHRVYAGLATDNTEIRHHVAQAEYWHAAVTAQFKALAAGVNEAVPSAVSVQEFLPIRSVTNGHVELHARDSAARQVVVVLTGSQALTVGAHLTAHGAVALDRIAAKVDDALPPIVRAVPFNTNSPAAPPAVPGPSTTER